MKKIIIIDATWGNIIGSLGRTRSRESSFILGLEAGSQTHHYTKVEFTYELCQGIVGMVRFFCFVLLFNFFFFFCFGGQIICS